MKKGNLFTVILIIITFTVNLYGQSSFIDYKDKKTGKRITYSDGFYAQNLRGYINYKKEVLLRLYPSYQGGTYYLVLTEYVYNEGLYDIGESIYEIADFYDDIYMLIEIGDIVYRLETQIEPVNKDIIAGSGSRCDYEDIKFKVEKETIIQIALAGVIELRIPMPDGREDYTWFQFSGNELDGFRDFVEGMKLISKD